jgi:large subunit ribosomal protein L9
MRVVLRSDVDSVGKKGDIVDVTPGYARNYLFPRGAAFEATAGIEAQAQSMRRKRDVKDAKDREGAESVARRLVPEVINIGARVGGKDGRLFGSVTTTDVAAAIAEQTGIEIDRHKMHIDDPIRSVGTHHVQVKLHADVQFQVTVEVAASP